MATIDRLCETGALTRIRIPLGRREFEDRRVYGFPEFLTWMDTVVPTLTVGRLKSERNPDQQLDNLLHTWITGKPVRYSRMFQDLIPAEDEVWEFKTPDLRVFGWVYRPRRFIAVFGDYADDYKGPSPIKSYETARTKVLRSRDGLDLDEPKFLQGMRFDDLV